MVTFSAVIPTRNRPQFLATALRSLLDQHEPPREIIVVDDGAGAADVARDVSPAIHVLDNRSRGPVPARVLGVSAATSDCIAFLDDDDWLTDRAYLGDAARHFADGADFCFGDGALVFSDGQADLPFSRDADASSLARDNTILISAVTYRRALHARLGAFDEALPYYWDWDWYLRVARSGARLTHHAVPVVAIRVHAQNMSGAETESQRRSNLDAFTAKHGLPHIPLKNHLSIAREGIS